MTSNTVTVPRRVSTLEDCSYVSVRYGFTESWRGVEIDLDAGTVRIGVHSTGTPGQLFRAGGITTHTIADMAVTPGRAPIAGRYHYLVNFVLDITATTGDRLHIHLTRPRAADRSWFPDGFDIHVGAPDCAVHHVDPAYVYAAEAAS